jgi:hypothetical protein
LRRQLNSKCLPIIFVYASGPRCYNGRMHTIIAIAGDGSWHARIGNPTVMGWVTVAACFLAAYLCGLVTRRTWRWQADHWPTLLAFWGGLTLAMAILGINSQLDLQSLFAQIARDLAEEQGWYAEQHGYQSKFIQWLVIFGVGGSAILFLFLVDVWRQTALALFGLSFLLVLIVAQASSLHHVDQFLGMQWMGMQMNWILQLSGVACIVLSAALGTLPRRLSSLRFAAR